MFIKWQRPNLYKKSWHTRNRTLDLIKMRFFYVLDLKIFKISYQIVMMKCKDNNLFWIKTNKMIKSFYLTKVDS